jgi:hypothetical protein
VGTGKPGDEQVETRIICTHGEDFSEFPLNISLGGRFLRIPFKISTLFEASSKY